METSDIERELRRLRRQVRWLMVGLALALALPLLGELFHWRPPPQPPPRQDASGELRTRRLVITDAEGRTRAELGLAPDGQEPHLVLSHPDGQRWAALAVASPPGTPPEHREAGLFLSDEAGKVRVSLGAAQRNSGLALYQPEGGYGLALYVDPDSQGLVVFDGQAPRLHLRYNQHDDAQLSELIFQDAQRQRQALLRGGAGGSALELYRTEGERAFRAP